MKERGYEKKFAGGMNMEIVYRILTWIITGTGCLFLMLIFAPFITVRSPVGSWIILPLIYGGLLFYNWKRKIKKDTLSAPTCFSKRGNCVVGYCSLFKL